MSGGRTIRRTTPERLEDLLKFITSCDNDADGDCAKIEEQAEVVEIAVEEGILVVPFDFDGHAVLEAVNGVGWRVHHLLIDRDARLETLLDPTLGGEF